MGKPVAKKKLGSCSLTLWENEWEGKKNYSYTLQRSYKKKDSEEWVNTEFFNPSDLPNVLALVQDTILSNIKKQKIESRQEPADQVKQEISGQEILDQDIPF